MARDELKLAWKLHAKAQQFQNDTFGDANIMEI